jgi:hypothetical protein
MTNISYNKLSVVLALLKFIGPSLVYIGFAYFIYVTQEAEPELSIDHVAYFKMTNSILGNHPDGSYWKEISSTKSYHVLMAYLYEVTGSHIISLKWILLCLTIFHLYAFQLFMSLFTPNLWKQMLFSLLAAIYVSFGATFWGITNFSASLPRTSVVPLIIIAMWFFIKKWDSPFKNVVFPFLIIGSIIHLSMYYIIGVLALVEMSSIVIEQRFRSNTRTFSFILMLALTVLLHTLINRSSLGTGSYISNTVIQGVARINQDHNPADNQQVLSPTLAWDVELFAFPWRNMPLPIATLVTMVLSVSFIFLLAALGLIKCVQNRLQKSDWIMISFAMSVLIMAYGLQTTLWLCRSWLPIYPINFEEVRVINFIMIPFLYFIFRLFDDQMSKKTLHSYAMAALIAVAVIIQPITIIRKLPDNIKSLLIKNAFELGLINPGDSLRLLYARQYLGLVEPIGRRYYYSALGVLGWLKNNAKTSDIVLTDLNEINILNVKYIGSFYAAIDKLIKHADDYDWISVVEEIQHKDRHDWMLTVKETHDVFSRQNIIEVVGLAKKYRATWVIVPWEAKGAVYSDSNYSVIKIE